MRAIHVGEPVSGAGKRAGVKESRRFACAVVSEASPAPALGTAHEPRPKGVSLHVAQHRQEVFVLLDRKGLKAPLPEMPA